MPEFECPFCHHIHTGQAPIAVLRSIKASGIRKAVLDILIASYPEGLARRSLVFQAYLGVRNGGPEFGDHVVANMLTSLREQLPQYGWTIPNYVSSGNRYRLAPIDEARDRAA